MEKTDQVKKALSEPGWHWLVLGGGLDYKDGGYKILFAALRSDGTFIESKTVRLPDECRSVEGKIREAIETALKSLEEFRTCICVVGSPCEKHRG